MKQVIALVAIVGLGACTPSHEDKCVDGELVTVHHDVVGSPASYKLDANHQIQRCGE